MHLSKKNRVTQWEPGPIFSPKFCIFGRKYYDKKYIFREAKIGEGAISSRAMHDASVRCESK